LPGLVLQSRVHVDARSRQRRHQAKSNPCRDTDGQEKREHPPIELDLSGARDLPDSKFDQQRSGPNRQQQTAQTAGNRQGEAFALRNLGLIHRAQGDIPPAVDFCRRAHTVLTEFGGRLSQAYAALSLAKSLIRADRLDEARDLLDWTLTTCRDLRDEFGQALALRTFAELCLAENSLSACETYVSESLRQWRRIQVPLWHARTLTVKADLDERRGRYSDAAAARAEAGETFARLGCRENDELRAAVAAAP